MTSERRASQPLGLALCGSVPRLDRTYASRSAGVKAARVKNPHPARKSRTRAVGGGFADARERRPRRMPELLGHADRARVVRVDDRDHRLEVELARRHGAKTLVRPRSRGRAPTPDGPGASRPRPRAAPTAGTRARPARRSPGTRRGPRAPRRTTARTRAAPSGPGWRRTARRSGPREGHAVVEELHDVGVGVEPGEGRAVGRAPGTQHEALGGRHRRRRMAKASARVRERSRREFLGGCGFVARGLLTAVGRPPKLPLDAEPSRRERGPGVARPAALKPRRLLTETMWRRAPQVARDRVAFVKALVGRHRSHRPPARGDCLPGTVEWVG